LWRDSLSIKFRTLARYYHFIFIYFFYIHDIIMLGVHAGSFSLNSGIANNYNYFNFVGIHQGMCTCILVDKIQQKQKTKKKVDWYRY
jgi:hypothetical protein